MTSFNWTEYTPTMEGAMPSEVAAALDEWEVEYRVRGGWRPGKRLAWLPGNTYRYRPVPSFMSETDPRSDIDRPVTAIPVRNPLLATDPRSVSLTEDPTLRAEYPIFDGFLAYFPNAVAEVSRLSYHATQQHHPGDTMHWDRSKSTDHLNKIGRHMIDAGKLDDKGLRHSVMLAWRAMANLQEELERDQGLPPSPASRNRPY